MDEASTAIVAYAPDLPALYAPTSGARERFAEFFAAQICNPHTRRAYLGATKEFASWCQAHGVSSLSDVRPLHVAAYIEGLKAFLSPPSVKQRLAALRSLFDWMVVGQTMAANPASSVRGPRHSVKKGKTRVLGAIEARALLDAIDISTPIGLRDRALIGVMVYSFARIDAVLKMAVEDVFVQGRRLWVRLHEKGGKEHEMPCHHNLETYLDAYMRIAEPTKGGKTPLFRSVDGRKVSVPPYHLAYRE